MARVLVAYGSKMGGTAGIAKRIGSVLSANGLDVHVVAAGDAPPPQGFDGAVVGGALYTMRWQRTARRYAARHAGGLRAVPTWFFSSGPLDGSAGGADIPPTRQVARLMRRAGCTRHRTFGGRMPEDASGFPAKAMARDKAGDWRDWDDIDAWAREIAESLSLVR